MRYYPVKHGTIMHVGTHLLKNPIHMKVFEKGNRLSYRGYGNEGMYNSWYTLSIRNKKVYLYLIRKPEMVGKQYAGYIHLPCLQINMLDTNNTDRYIYNTCKYGFDGDPLEKLKGKGVYTSILKLTYDKISEQIKLPKIDYTKFLIEDLLKLAAYPILRESYKLFKTVPNNIPTVLSPVFRKATTIKELTKLLYGKKYDYGANEIVNALKTDEWKNINNGYYLRGFLPIEYIKEVDKTKLKIPYSSYFMLKDYREHRKFFKLFNPKKLRNFLLTGKDYELSDTIHLYNDFSHVIPLPTNINKLTELHDFYSAEVSKIKQKDYPINYSEKILTLDNITLDNLKLVIPKTNHELINWGRKMSNCIGSYGNRASEMGRILLGVFRENELIYNIEINRKRIQQFFARRNSTPDKTDYEIIKNYLAENKFIQKDVLDGMVTQIGRIQ